MALSPSGRPRSRSAVPRPCLPSLLSFLRPKELRLHRLSMPLGRGCAPGRLFFPQAADVPARSVQLPAFHGRRSGLLPRPRLHIRLRPGALHGTVRDAAGLPLQGLLHTPAHLLLELLCRLTGRPLQSRSLSHRRRRSILPGLLPVGQLLPGHDPRHRGCPGQAGTGLPLHCVHAAGFRSGRSHALPQILKNLRKRLRLPPQSPRSRRDLGRFSALCRRFRQKEGAEAVLLHQGL